MRGKIDPEDFPDKNSKKYCVSLRYLYQREKPIAKINTATNLEGEEAGSMAKVQKDEKIYCRVEVIAGLFGVSVRRIQQLTQDGVISTTQISKGRRYEAVSTIQQYIQYLSNKAYGKAKSDTEAELKEQKLRAEVALKESQGELHRIRTEIATGRYISVEEVKIDYSRFFVSFKKFAMALPSKMAGRLSNLIDPVEVRRLENELQKEIVKLLKGFVMNAVVEEGSDNGKEKKDLRH